MTVVNTTIEKFQQERYIDLEKAILCQLVTDYDCFYRVSEVLRPIVFTEWRETLAEIVWEWQKGAKFYDVTLIQDELRARLALENQIFPTVEFLELASGYYSELEQYTVKILSQYYTRQGLQMFTEAQEQLFKGETYEQVFSSIVKQNEELLAWSQSTDKGEADYMEAIRQIEDTDKMSGLNTIMDTYNSKAGGFCGGDYILLAARPGMGKTTVALQECLNQAEQGNPAAFFSLEETKVRLIQKLAAYKAGVDPHIIPQINRSEYTNERNRLVQAIHEINELPLYIYDLRTKGMSSKVEDIISIIRVLVKKFELKIAFIDYIQLLRTYQKIQSREERVSEISYQIRQAAVLFDIPMIPLSQLNRAVETRGGSKRPELSDLRESGSLEQDASDVMFVYRPEYYQILEDEEGQSLKGQTHIIFAKCRKNGDISNDVEILVFDQNKRLVTYDPDLADPLNSYKSGSYQMPDKPEPSPVISPSMATKMNKDDIPF